MELLLFLSVLFCVFSLLAGPDQASSPTKTYTYTHPVTAALKQFLISLSSFPVSAEPYSLRCACIFEGFAFL